MLGVLREKWFPACALLAWESSPPITVNTTLSVLPLIGLQIVDQRRRWKACNKLRYSLIACILPSRYWKGVHCPFAFSLTQCRNPDRIRHDTWEHLSYLPGRWYRRKLHPSNQAYGEAVSNELLETADLDIEETGLQNESCLGNVNVVLFFVTLPGILWNHKVRDSWGLNANLNSPYSDYHTVTDEHCTPTK